MISVDVTLGQQPYRTSLRTANHEWVGDEPVALGGGDLGPVPYELLLSALGSCTVITMRMYADRKGWVVREVFCTLTHEKQTRKHPDGTGSVQVDVVTKRVRIDGDLDADQVDRLMQISGKCPVHRTLEGCMEIQTLNEGV